jgi:hypothetical protein
MAIRAYLRLGGHDLSFLVAHQFVHPDHGHGLTIGLPVNSRNKIPLLAASHDTMSQDLAGSFFRRTGVIDEDFSRNENVAPKIDYAIANCQ